MLKSAVRQKMGRFVPRPAFRALFRQARNRHPAKQLRKQWPLAICLALYCAGLLAGAASLSGAAQQGYFGLFAAQYISSHLSQPVSTVWQVDFLSGMLSLTVLLFGALSCAGAPLVCAVPLFRGLCTGLLTGWLYTNLGGAGLLMNTLIFWLPNTGISALTVWLGGVCLKNSVLMGKCLSGAVRPLPAGKLRQLVWQYFMVCLACLGFCLLQAALLAVFGPVFRG